MQDITDIIRELSEPAKDNYDISALIELLVKAADLQPNRRIVIGSWRTDNGECYDCGLPAEFRFHYKSLGMSDNLCSVCAANHAADGETIERIDKNFPS